MSIHPFDGIHPSWPSGNICIDFRPYTDIDPPELWQPEGAKYIDDELVLEHYYYNGEFLHQPRQLLTTEQQLELLDEHPIFTSKCPQCGAEFESDSSRIHWDCDQCGWMDDSI